MKLEEAIKHYEKLASEKTDPISGYIPWQLAEWLKELKHYRSKNKNYYDLD